MMHEGRSEAPLMLTVVVLTPQCSDGGIGVGAGGVSMYSNSSDASDEGLDISAASYKRL